FSGSRRYSSCWRGNRFFSSGRDPSDRRSRRRVFSVALAAHGESFVALQCAVMSSARLLVDPPLSGPENMARDEALLRTCDVTGATVVRFYAWSEPTISLGYFQDYAD